MNVLFERFNPITITNGTHTIYPKTDLFSNSISTFCLHTSELTSSLCVNYFHPNEIINIDDFKLILKSSLNVMFASRLRKLAFQYAKSEQDRFQIFSEKEITKLKKKFDRAVELMGKDISIGTNDAYQQACYAITKKQYY